MDKDMEKAIEIYRGGEYTCVLCKDNTVYTSCVIGIKPMIEFISKDYNLNDFSAADKIVGKAAAMLFHFAGIKAVYGEVVSEKAIDYLNKEGIEIYYKIKTASIINRKGDDICPMEKMVANINNPKEAYAALLDAVNKLSKG